MCEETIKTSAIQWMLLEWGRWSRSDKRLGYPSCTPFERLRGGGIASAMVTDDTASLVDMAVSSLKRANLSQARALKWYYVKNLPLHLIARKLRVDRAQALQIIASGENSVQNILESG